MQIIKRLWQELKKYKFFALEPRYYHSITTTKYYHFETYPFVLCTLDIMIFSIHKLNGIKFV